ncbi:ATP-dependent helicase [Butyrivibrio sp. XPD2006]|uniref:ATP-dependent helicase n=1 Tax=Butyrivibrio sp. XPD2006 TaxID=1280668 RepID=UPI0003B35FB4|nr:ATP-dependent helicase [Butyrivibrio sp. XPD2006]
MKLNTLNDAQLQAVRHKNGPAIVLAGPGSGKTKVIVERLRYMIEEHHIPPSAILVITFTKAAAIEMQYRFLKITDSSYPEVVFGTFHSVFYKIIRNSKSKNESKLEIANEKIKYEILRDSLSMLRSKGKIDDKTYEDAGIELPDIISEISRIKNLGITPDKAIETLSISPVFTEIFDYYNNRLVEFGMIDFDDMIVRCMKMLSENKSILKTWQERFKYILIDEYQDINPVQYSVVRLLLGDSNNIFAVGDDDQSIYGFRGSDPKIMLDFRKSFEEFSPKFINLSINYRCGREILENALKIIEENNVRYAKKLSAFEGNGKGAVVTRRYVNKKIQNETIALFLKKHIENLNEIAILYRTNSEAMQLAMLLHEYGIPTSLDNQNKSLFTDKAVELCISYISFAYNGQKRSDFYKIINKPMRYISRDCAPSEAVKEIDVCRYYRGNSTRLKSAREFFSQISMINHLRPSLMIRYLRKTIGIDELYPGSKSVLDEFERISSEYNDSRKFLTYLLMRQSAESDNRNKKQSDSVTGNRVNIMTMHGSKGLEFDTVWLPDLNEGIIPTRSAVTCEQIEEERRMLYVAMTRAKKALIMSYITGNKENQMLPSRFIRPIRKLWEKTYKENQTSSEPSSGRSISSSNSASSR